MIIKFSNHSKIQMLARGANEKEVIETISEGVWMTARENKFHCTKTFSFHNISPINKQFYMYKTIDSIFVNEISEIYVITVKVYYHNDRN